MADGSYGSATTSVFRLPALKPPTDGLIALLDVPATAKLHVPVPMRLIVRNRRVSRSANVIVQVDFDASDGFVLAGLRSGRIPILLPGGEEVLTWNMIPVECGLVKIPRIKVTDRRTPVGAEPPGDFEGEEVPVVDIRRGARSDAGQTGAADNVRKSLNVADRRSQADVTVLVLP